MDYGIIFLIILIVFVLSKYINISKIEREKLTAYECGFQEFIEETSAVKKRYYLKYYIIAIIFLIFDLEILLLYPFITSFSHFLSFFSLNLSNPSIVQPSDLDILGMHQNTISLLSLYEAPFISYIIIIFFIFLLFLGLIFETNKFIII